MTNENHEMGQERWHQRFTNFRKALIQLEKAVLLASEKPLSDLEKQGLIQAFEFTHELAWNVMRDFILYQGAASITGSRDATREAFQRGLIEEGERWMDMIRSRNLTSHTYHAALADEIADTILKSYYRLFQNFKAFMEQQERTLS